MTTTDPTTHTEGQIETGQSGQHAEPTDAADTFLDYAASEYTELTELAKRAPRMPIDVEIAATIGAGYETRELRGDVQTLTAAIRGLEAVISDHTATMRAFLAQGDRFALEEAEDAQRAVEEAAVQQKAVGA